MTKADIVAEISTSTGLDRKQVSDVVESFFTVMKNQMSRGENIYFRGFGSFILKKRARKVARNIAKNTSLIIEPHSIPAFKPAKLFIDDVRSKVVHSDEKAAPKKKSAKA